MEASPADYRDTMTRMRPLLVFSLVLFFGLPAYADDLPLPAPSSKEAKPAYHGRKDQCLTENLSIEKGKLTVTNDDQSQAYKACVEKNKTKGCTAAPKTKEEAAKCTCGSVSYEMLGDKVCGPISKCSLEYEKEVKKCTEGTAGKALADAAIRDIASDAVKNMPRDAEGNLTDAGREQLSKTLQNLRVDEARANEIVNSEKDSRTAYDMVQALAEGDTAKAQELATTLELNDEVKTNFARLEAKDLPDVLDGVMTKDQQDTARVFAQSTGFQAPEAGKDATSGEEPDLKDGVADFCNNGVIRGCATGCITPTAPACRLNNPGAVICSGVMQSVGCGCGGKFAHCPTLEQGVAGAYKNLMNNYFPRGFNTVQSIICKWAPNSDGNDCVGYSRIVSRALGVSPNQTLDPNDTVTMGKLLMGISRVEGGRGAIFTPTQLESGIKIALGDLPIPTASPGFLSKFVPSNVRVGDYSSPFGLGFFNSADRSDGASAGGFSGNAPYQGGGSGSAGAVRSGGSMAPAQQTAQQPVSQAIFQQGNIQSNTNVSETVQAVASIIAEPREVMRGNPITVSWSSVGTSQSAPCEVFLQSGTGTSSIARGNEGSERVPTSAATGTLMWGFTLQCTALSGTRLIQQATSVSIK